MPKRSWGLVRKEHTLVLHTLVRKEQLDRTSDFCLLTLRSRALHSGAGLLISAFRLLTLHSKSFIVRVAHKA